VPHPPLQQVVDISIVMLSAPVPQQQPTPQHAEPPKPVAQPIAPQPAHVVKKETSRPAPVAQSAANPPTTGLQSPRAVQQVAAITQPVFNATSLHNSPPAYPADARRQGIQGKVLLEVKVASTGAAENVNIRHSSGYASLDATAITAVQKWHFIPAQQGNETVEAMVLVPVEFRLE